MPMSKKKIAYHPLSIQLIKPLEPKSVEIHKEDSNMLARKVVADVAYIDPPYILASIADFIISMRILLSAKTRVVWCCNET